MTSMTSTITIGDVRNAIDNGTVLDGTSESMLSSDAMRLISGVIQYSGSTTKEAKALERQARMRELDRLSYRNAGLVEDGDVKEIYVKLDRRVLSVPNNESGVLDRLFAAVSLLIANDRITLANAHSLGKATTGILIVSAYKIGPDSRANSRKFKEHELMPRININRLTLLDALFIGLHRKILEGNYDVDAIITSILAQQKKHSLADLAIYRKNAEVQSLIQSYNDRVESDDPMSVYLRQTAIDADVPLDQSETVKAEKEAEKALKKAVTAWKKENARLNKERKGYVALQRPAHDRLNALLSEEETLMAKEDKDEADMARLPELTSLIAHARKELETVRKAVKESEDALEEWQLQNPIKA